MIDEKERAHEIARIKADPHQMQMVLACMMQCGHFAELVLAVYRHYNAKGYSSDDPGGAMVDAIEEHVIQHATAAVQLRLHLALLHSNPDPVPH